MTKKWFIYGGLGIESWGLSIWGWEWVYPGCSSGYLGLYNINSPFFCIQKK